MRIAINGFGRIGKTFLRTLLADPKTLSQITVSAINIGSADIAWAAHLFAYDSVMGPFEGTAEVVDDCLVINKTYIIPLLATTDPDKLAWKRYEIDWVVDCSGRFTTKQAAELHIKQGAQRVLISAPAHDDDISIVMGINHDQFDAQKHRIVSLGSCTTNALMPLLYVLHKSFGIKEGIMSTIHAYTNSQVLLDVPASDPRMARAAALNIIPTKTGAHNMIAKIMPELKGKIAASAFRVPVANVSIVNLNVSVEKKVAIDAIHDAFKTAMQHQFKRIIDLTQVSLVSSDFMRNPHSVIIDEPLTQVIGSTVSIAGWYDNEWGYSCRMKDFIISSFLSS